MQTFEYILTIKVSNQAKEEAVTARVERMVAEACFVKNKTTVFLVRATTPVGRSPTAPLRVKVVKASKPTYWYAKHVGKTFCVTRDDTNVWYVYHRSKTYTYLVLKYDCEIVG